MIPSLPESLHKRDLLDFADARLVGWLAGRARVTATAEDVEALVHVLCALCLARAEGSLAIPLDADGLAASVHRALEALPENEGLSADEAAARQARRFLDAADAAHFAAILGTESGPRPLVRIGSLLAFHRDAFAERTIADRLRALRDAPRPAPGAEIEAILRETLEERRLRGRDGTPITLSPRQREALETALREGVFVLAGGPGTGKTTWTAAWLRAMLRLPGADPERIRLCAPTGRAARRMEESLRATLAGRDDDPRDAAAAGMRVTTLHALLGWNAYGGRFARTQDDPLDADVVLLDEASMADARLMAALLRALRPGTRLVLAGDPGQLPAVEAGAVLEALLPETGDAAGPVPSVTLDASHRATGAVIPLAAAIRGGRADDVLGILGPPAEPAQAFAGGRDVARVDAPEDATARLLAERLSELLHAYADAAFGRGANGEPSYAALLERFRFLPREEEAEAVEVLWRMAGRTRVLSPLRKGVVSAEGANRMLRQRLEPAWRRPGDSRAPGGFHGAPILVMRNDARTGLSNGDLGLWLETGDGATAFFPRPDAPDGWLRLPVALLPAHEPGFASTVHKSQGSECDEVLLLLPQAGNRLLARETFYTAVTRARHSVKVFGAEAALREAVEHRLERRGALRQMMREGKSR